MNNFIKAARHVLRSRMVKQAGQLQIGDQVIPIKEHGKVVGYNIIPAEPYNPNDMSEYLAKDYLYSQPNWENDTEAIKQFVDAPRDFYYDNYREPDLPTINQKALDAVYDYLSRNPEVGKKLRIKAQRPKRENKDSAYSKIFNLQEYLKEKIGVETVEQRMLREAMEANKQREEAARKEGKRYATGKEELFLGFEEPYPEEMFTKVREAKLSSKEKELLRKYMQIINAVRPKVYTPKMQEQILNDELYGLAQLKSNLWDDDNRFHIIPDWTAEYPAGLPNVGNKVRKLFDKKYKEMTGKKNDASYKFFDKPNKLW